MSEEMTGERSRSASSVDGFAWWMNRKYSSPDTVRQYVSTAKTFDAEAGLSEISTETVLDWMRSHDDWSNQTVSRHVYALKAYAKYAGAAVDWDRVPRPSEKSRYRAIPVNVVQELFDACVTLEEKLVFKLGYDLALRVREFCKMTVEDVDLDTGDVDLERIKKGSSTVIKIDPDTLAVLRAFLKEKGRSEGLIFGFGTQTAQGIVRSVRERLSPGTKAILEKEGIKVTPHVLRHSRATDLFDQDWDLHNVRELLGHRDVRTTQAYTKPKGEKITAMKLEADSPRMKTEV